MHHPLGNVPLENDAVDRVGSQPEYLLALREAKFGLFALGDIARIDHDAVDQRIGERGDTARLQPSIGAILVASAKLARESFDLAGDQLPILGEQILAIIGMCELEHKMRLAFLGGIAERILHAGADIFHAAVRSRQS